MPHAARPSTAASTARNTGTAARSTTRSSGTDAVKLLKDDHKEVKSLFREYDKLAKAEDESREDLAREICAMLTVHATVEEEIFYPSAREVLDDKDLSLVDEAAVEHATAKDLIAQIEASSCDSDLYDAKMKVLSEYVDHHVKEEEEELFPKVKKAGLDTKAVGAELAERKEALTAQQADGH
ncbi:MAG: hemerythrin domain-containing protein [Rubrivivax sp.]|nr:hemerythrin domain-containing protein [Rubrivivax sp.]